MASSRKTVPINKQLKQLRYTTDEDLDASAVTDIKKEYNQAVLNQLVAKKEKTILWTRKAVNYIIKYNNFKDVASYVNPENYSVVMNEGKLRLMERCTVKRYTMLREVVPLEDTFQTIWAIHKLMDHPPHESLMEYINGNYVVNPGAVVKIDKICYVCKAKGKFNITCRLYLVDMSDRNDDTFSSVLVYEDLQTGYVHLRPISQDSTDLDVGLELMKIFMDFGPPANIEICDPIFKLALKYVHSILPFHFNYKIITIPWDEERMSMFRRNIMKWQYETGSPNWGFGCMMLQWDMNNSIRKSGDYKSSPWNKVFIRETCLLKPLSETNTEETGIINTEMEMEPMSSTTLHEKPKIQSDSTDADKILGSDIVVGPTSSKNSSEQPKIQSALAEALHTEEDLGLDIYIKPDLDADLETSLICTEELPEFPDTEIDSPLTSFDVMPLATYIKNKIQEELMTPDPNAEPQVSDMEIVDCRTDVDDDAMPVEFANQETETGVEDNQIVKGEEVL